MPNKLSEMRVPDPFAMNQDEVRQSVVQYFLKCGFDVKEQKKDNEIDIIAVKDGSRLIIEARGSQARNHDYNTVFDTSQIAIHFSEQINQMMKLYENLRANDILVIANPDIPRIRKHIEKIPKALDKLGIVRMWVSPDKSVNVQGLNIGIL